MKLPIFLSVLICTSELSAQVLKVNSVQKLNIPHQVEKIMLAPSGDFLLESNFNNQGLIKIDLKTFNEQVITNAAGAGYNASILKNGDIIYREVTKEPIKKISIRRYNTKKETSTVLLAATRENIQTTNLADADNIITNNDFQLQLTLNGQTSVLTPLGKEARYIWPAISPNKKKLLFFVSGDGAYVTDIDGKKPIALGILRAAKWYNDSIVVGQRDIDNGEITTSSQIIAKNIMTNQEQILTSDSVIAMYPSVSNEGDKILFSTPQGDAFLINIIK